jgi:predicted ArsR family transcriptional regulator
MPDTETAAELVTLLADERTRTLLALASEEPRSAKALAEQTDISLKTAYRRTEALEERGLLRSSLALDEGGNHYAVFETAVSDVDVTIDPQTGGIDIDISHDSVDRFIEFWEGLREKR